MTRNRFRLAAAGFSCAATALLATCAAAPEPATGGFAMQVSALTGTCGSGSTNSPLGEIRSFKLFVRKPDADGVLQPYPHFSALTSSFNGSSKSITFTGIPADSPLEVSLQGYTQDSKPAWFARKSALTVNKLETLVVDITLMASEGFTCVQPDAGLYKLAFPVVTKIASDKILITGGFSDYSKDGADFKLAGPVSQAWLFDPAKGTFTDAGQLKQARGGHSAIYLPKSGKILIAGGANKMAVKADGSAPPTWTPADAVNPRWEICSLDTNNQLNCSSDDSIQDNVKPRVMPNLMLLTADYVVASGGAPWPTTDSLDFRCADLFDPTLATQVDGGKGGFVKLKPGALCMNGSRAGAAIAPFSQPTEAGTLHYLIWGGNQFIMPSGSPSTPPGKVVEEAYESSALGDVKFNDDWQLLGTDGKPATEYTEAAGSLFFPTLSSLGPATIDLGDGSPVQKVERFAAIGGTRWKDGVWAKPSPDDAYLLTVNSAKKTIVIQKMPGLSAGVFLHTATATGGHVVVGGGLSALTGGGAALTNFEVNPDDPLGPLYVNPDAPTTAADAFIKRGALAAQKLSNDCVLMFGGVSDFADLTSPNNGGGASDVYCPGFLAQ
jgi:hypothetical protein